MLGRMRGGDKMTLSYVPPERSWGEIVAHVLLRIVLLVAGYLVAVLVTLIATVLIYSVLSSFPGAPSYFGAMTVTPIVALIVPWVGGLIYLVALILSFAPAIVLALITEALRLRSIFLHMLIGGAVGGGTFAFSAPTLLEGAGPITDWRDAAIVAGGGVVGGITYWLVAGRGAGFRMDRPEWPTSGPAA